MSDLALVFGASGTLGSTITDRLSRDCEVIRLTRNSNAESSWLSTSSDRWVESIAGRTISRVIWAQGANAAGGIDDSPAEDLLRLFEANVNYIVSTLSCLRAASALREGSRICIVSSIWQAVARESKLAYVTTKSAVGGLVRSLAADLGPDGIAVNAVLPGVVMSPMTSTFLDDDALRRLRDETPTHELVTASDIAEVVTWITSASSHGIHGQSIVVDNGWSVVRRV